MVGCVVAALVGRYRGTVVVPVPVVGKLTVLVGWAEIKPVDPVVLGKYRGTVVAGRLTVVAMGLVAAVAGK